MADLTKDEMLDAVMAEATTTYIPTGLIGVVDAHSKQIEDLISNIAKLERQYNLNDAIISMHTTILEQQTKALGVAADSLLAIGQEFNDLRNTIVSLDKRISEVERIYQGITARVSTLEQHGAKLQWKIEELTSIMNKLHPLS